MTMTTTKTVRNGQIRVLGGVPVRILSAARGGSGTVYVIEYLAGASRGHRETRSRQMIVSCPVMRSFVEGNAHRIVGAF